MVEQSFATSTRKPCVILTHLEGNLTVRSWSKHEIRVEADGPISGLQQQDDILTITDCKSDLALWVPAIKNHIFSVFTSISATDLSRNANIEGAANVELRDVGGNVTLENIYGNVELVNVSEVARATAGIGGNLRTAHLPKLFVQQGVGGNAILLDTRQIELDAVGGNLAVTMAQSVSCGVVGGNLDAEQVEAIVRSNNVGGNCDISNSANAEVRIDAVAGNLRVQSAALTHSSVVGGNARLWTGFPLEAPIHLNVGGNATITLPDPANISIHAYVGGNVSGSTFKLGGGSINLTYGEGTAKVDLHIGGNLHLQGGGVPQSSSSSRDNFGREMADLGRQMGREMENLGRQINREIRRSLRY